MATSKRSTGPTKDELLDENEQLRSELEATQSALDAANERLSQIYDLSSEEIQPEDFESDESDLDETYPEDEED